MVEDQWNFENVRSSDFTDSTVVNLIKPYYEQVTEEKLKFVHHGSYNVYEVDDYVFRIPDRTLYNEKGYQLIHEELKKLEFLQPRLSQPIPQPIFISYEPLKPLVGYKKLPGVSVEKIWSRIPENNKLSLAKEISLFLNEFHSITMTQEYLMIFKEEPVTQDTIKTNYQKIYQQTREKIFPIIVREEQVFLQELFVNYFAEFEKGTFIPSLTHQDFDMSNILIDPESYKLTGIIDFEDMGIGDPAYDLIFISQGKEIFNTILDNYSNKKDDFLLKRIKFYYQRTAVPYLLYGIEHDLPDMITYGKYMLRRRLLSI